MREELDVFKWWVTIGVAVIIFQKMGKAAVNIWNAPQFLKDFFN